MNTKQHNTWEVIEAIFIILWHVIKWTVIVGLIIWAGVTLFYLAIFIIFLMLCNGVMNSKPFK